MSTRIFSDMPETVAPGSYVKVSKTRDGTFAVATYDRTSPGMVKMTGRWFGADEREADLIAFQLEGRGYTWRRS